MAGYQFNLNRTDNILQLRSSGLRGAQGEPGEGVPVGGSAGEVLTKQSGTDYDTSWEPVPSAAVQSVNGQTGVVVLDKTDIGLGNVDNTSDLNKPISTATQSALDLKEDLSNKSDDTNLGNSTSLYPTQNAVKSYVDTAGGAYVLKSGDTMTGELSIENTSAGQSLQITPTGDTGSSSSVGGAVNIDMTNASGAGLVVYSNDTTPTGHLAILRSNQDAFDNHGLFVDYRGTTNAVNIVRRSLSSGTSSASAFNMTSDNEDGSAVQIRGLERALGTTKITHENPSTSDGNYDANAAALSIDLVENTTTGAGTAAQGLYIDSTTGTTGLLLRLRNTSLDQVFITSSGGAVFNEQGNDADFRVEGDTDSALLFVDASTDRLGVGTSTPSSKLHVLGSSTTLQNTSGDTLVLDALTTNNTIIRFRDDGAETGAIFSINGSTNLTVRAQSDLLLTSNNSVIARTVTLGSSAMTLGTGLRILTPDGSAATPSYSFTSDPDTGLFRSGTNSLTLVGGGATTPTTLLLDTVTQAIKIDRSSTSIPTLLNVTSSSLSASSTEQVAVLIDPTIVQTSTAGYIGLVIDPTETSTGSGTNLLADFRLGGTSQLQIGTDGSLKAGNTNGITLNSSGGNNVLQWGTGGTATLGLFGATPVVQPSTTGTTAGFTAGVGTGVNDDSTFTGGTGASAYTIGDIVLALKQLGALAA